MGISDLVRQWEESSSDRLAEREYQIKLILKDAARISALVEMYPRRSEAELISELLTAALDDLEKAMPYIPGTEVVSEDEDGNPIYEDVGPTPRFHMLLQKYVQKFGSG